MRVAAVIYFCIVGAFGACPNIILREEWNARPPFGVAKQPIPVPYVVIHHAETESCFDFDSCSSIVRRLQDEHMDVNGWSDIGFNFLVGEDGNIYEGRGWDGVGSHTPGFNSLSVGVSFIGTFSINKPNDVAINAAKLLNECGVEQGFLFTDFVLIGHRQAVTSECPGNALYDEITSWPNFQPVP